MLLDLPFGWDPQRLEEDKRRIGFGRQSQSRFGIIPRHGTSADVDWFEHEPAYVHHTIDA